MIDGLPSDLQRILRTIWGYDRLRPLQAEAMAAVLGGRDSLVVLPTGGGKSLCYQAPILASGGLAVVVSPLISLMKDQVDGLHGHGVAAERFDSSLSPPEREGVRRRLREGTVRLLYVSPERLVGASGPSFRRLLSEVGVRYLAIDEAHCISQWGHDFRPEYRQLGELRRTLPGLSIHAFTATATERVRADIVDQLQLDAPEILVGSFDRPNLVYRARRRENRRQQILAVMARHPGGGGIVYCLSRKDTERIATQLEESGVRAVPYHAGLDDDTRRRHQDAFSEERVDVVVATVAFGMGIDRSNVRYVIHAGVPRSVEHYQQEAGRAGRDGLEADCLLLWSPGDFAAWRRLLDGSGQLTPAAGRQLADVSHYATTTRCRHRFLVEYFGQESTHTDCGACDVCLGELELVDGAEIVAQKILSCVLRVREAFGVGHVLDVLRGVRSEKVATRKHDELSTWGLLAEHSIAELRGFVDQLLLAGHLRQNGREYPTLAVTERGWELLRGDASCELVRHRRPPRRRRAAGRTSGAPPVRDPALFDRLRELRRRLAAERGVPPYVIFHDSTLAEIVDRRPSTTGELLAVPGIGEKKAAAYGGAVLELLAAAGAPPPS